MKLFLIFSLLSLVPMTTYAAEVPQVTPSSEEYEISIGSDGPEAEASYNYNFGRVRVGRAESTVFTLRNRGRIPVYINDIDLEGDNAFHKNENCPSLLLRGQSCRVRVTFRPWAVGRFEAELEINLTGASDIDVDLRGRGVRRDGGGIDL